MRCFFLVLGFLSLQAFAVTTRFDFRDAIQRNTLEVTVQGPFERTTAISHFVGGWTELDLDNVAPTLRGELEFDTRTFETGIESKNLFLKERLLDSTQFPKVQAAFMKVVPPVTGKVSSPEGAKLKVEVGLKVKGQTKVLELPIRIQYHRESELSRQRLPGNLLILTSDSEVPLDRLGISIPEGFRASSAANARVVLHMVGSDKLPIGAASLPDGIKPKDPLQPNPSPRKTE